MKTNYSVSFEAQKGKAPLQVRVKFTDGRTYKVFCYDTDMLAREVATSGNGCFGVPGLIVLDDVSMTKIREVLASLVESGFFEGLLPEEEGQ